LALPLEEEDKKPKNGGPSQRITRKTISKTKTKHKKVKNKEVDTDELQSTYLG
jgi:hypothetical protein